MKQISQALFTYLHLGRIQLLGLIFLVAFSLGEAILLVNSAEQINLLVGGALESNQFRVVREIANLQREVLKSQTLLQQLIINQEEDISIVENRFAFAKISIRNTLARANNPDEAHFFNPESLLKIAMINEEFEQIDEIFGELNSGTLTPESRQELLLQLNQELEESEPLVNSLFLLQEKEEIKTVEGSLGIINRSLPVLAAAGVVLVLMNIALAMIMARTAAVVGAANQRFQLAAAAVNSAIFDWQIAANQIFWSEGIERVFGYSAQKTGTNREWWLEKIHPEDRTAFEQSLQTIISSQETLFDSEYRFCHQNGQYIDVAHRGKIVRDSHGEAIRMVCSLEDITQRRLVLAYQEADRLKTKFLANVSHELRTPLTSIIGFAEVLRAGHYGQLSDKQERVVVRIVANGQHLLSLINNLLDRTQLEAGAFKLHRATFITTELLEVIPSTLNVLAETKGLSLTTEVADDVPAVLEGDLQRLRQILINLVGNGIKFTEQGGVHVRLYCPDGDSWAMDVADTGPGIPAESQSRLFGAFQQIDDPAGRSQKGFGLGLYIVKELALLMGGRAQLTKTSPAGTTFTVIFPKKKG